jgi:hypothetical protein
MLLNAKKINTKIRSSKFINRLLGQAVTYHSPLGRTPSLLTTVLQASGCGLAAKHHPRREQKQCVMLRDM